MNRNEELAREVVYSNLENICGAGKEHPNRIHMMNEIAEALTKARNDAIDECVKHFKDNYPAQSFYNGGCQVKIWAEIEAMKEEK